MHFVLRISNYYNSCHKNLKYIHITLIKTYFKTTKYIRIKYIPPYVYWINCHDNSMKFQLEISRTCENGYKINIEAC